MDTTVSLEALLRKKIAKLDELKLATMLLQNRNPLQEQLLCAKLEMDTLTNAIGDMKSDLETMKAQNTQFRILLQSLKQLESKIVCIERNLSPECIMELTRRYQAAAPLEKNDNGASITTANNVSNGKFAREAYYSISDTPEPHMGDCKKTLFKNPEDSYSMELLSEEEFSKIPKYMIGRQSLATLNDLVTTINAILKAKYGLLALGKNGARKKGKLDLYLSLKRDETPVTPGKDPIYFFTAEDYYRHTQTKLDKTKLNLLTVLRHCKRLRELRVGKSSVQYVLVPSWESGASGFAG